MNEDLKSKIEELLNELILLKGILPGSISKQYNVCGTPNCKCKDPENPVKHGPYYQLSYTVSGRNSSKFIKKDDLNSVSRMRNNYKRFKEICFQLPGLYIDLFRNEGFNAELPDVHNAIESEVTVKLNEDNKKLKNKLNAAREKLYNNYTTIYDLSESRDKWKSKAAASKSEAKIMKDEITKLNKQLVHKGFEVEQLKELKKKRDRS